MLLFFRLTSDLFARLLQAPTLFCKIHCSAPSSRMNEWQEHVSLSSSVADALPKENYPKMWSEKTHSATKRIHYSLENKLGQKTN
jgi:hypothetical protein